TNAGSQPTANRPRPKSASRPTPPGCAACPTTREHCSAPVSATNTCAAAPGSPERMTIPFHALRLARLLLVLLLAASPALASAEVRAWLDRDRIELGETATLNIETDGAERPDYA